jgi:hypothetical protein
MVDAIFDSHAIGQCNRIDLNRETDPDATTWLKFRRLLEAIHRSMVKSSR